MAPPLIALFGATALGKSEVAARLAELSNGEIVVADSMQLYRGLGIVTNQPSEEERRRVPRNLVGYVSPQEEYDVASYARDAHEVIDRLQAAGRHVVVEGGSGLYLRAALGDLAFSGGTNQELRRTLEARWAADPADVLAELWRLDPATAERLDLANPRRVLRALEAVTLAGGRPLPPEAHRELWRPAERYEHRLFALLPDAEGGELTRRIERRVDLMLASGALEEVARARAAGPFSRTVLQAIGVRELCAHLDGELSLQDAAVRMKARTRSLARRQATWMRKLPSSCLVRVVGRRPEAVADEILTLSQRPAW